MPSPEVGSDRPRLCFVGPLLGRHPGRVVSQGETAAALFREAGYPVRTTSSVRNPLLRAVDIGADLIRWRGDIDVLMVMVFSGRAFVHADLASALGKTMSKAVVLQLHGGNLPAFAAEHPRWVDRVLGRAAAVVAPSRYLAGAFTDRGYDVSVIPNVVPLDDYEFRPRDPVRPRVLWMRAFDELYQPALALEVLALVRRELPEAVLTMAGQDSGLLETVRRRAAEMGLTDAVRFPGYLEGAAKRAALAEHDVFLNTTRIDNMPITLLEAAASGLPIVATAVGGVPDLFADGEAALLAPDQDAAGLAGGVVRLVREPWLAVRLSGAARTVAVQSDWSVVKPMWDSLLASLT